MLMDFNFNLEKSANIYINNKKESTIIMTTIKRNMQRTYKKYNH